ncbi:MAG: hypothetical protein ACI9G1_002037 [Pirellulaceae bacterium]|jgi:hypothetical protein
MYLRFSTRLEFPALASTVCADSAEAALDWDSENVYEWMYVTLPELDYSLNVSREHGWADIDDELLDLHEGDDAELRKLRKLAKPGPVYVYGWDREKSDYVDELPDSVAQTFAQRLAVDVYVYAGRINVDKPDDTPVVIIKPTAE